MNKVTRKKNLGGYPAFGVILSITLALFFVGLFGILISYYNQFEKLVRENISVKVYLNGNLSETRRKQLEQILAAKQFVAKTERSVTFFSKEEAKEQLKSEIGDYEEVLGENPFKDVFIVKIDPVFHDTISLNKIKTEIEKQKGVFEVEYEKVIVEAVNRNFAVISMVVIGIALVFIISVVVLINNTMRLALFSQRFLIRSMQLVGATKWFIQRPFLWRACLYGIIAALISCGVLYTLTSLGYRKIEYLSELHNQDHFLILAGAMVVLGMVMSVLSTFFSINKYLKMSLDELY